MYTARLNSTRRRLVLLGALGLSVLIAAPVVAVAQNRPGPDYSKFPPEKRALLEAQDRAIATAQAGPKPPKDPRDSKGNVPQAAPPPPRPGSQPRRLAGAGTIIETGLAPFPAQQFFGQNRWVETKGGNDVVVYAGADGEDPSQGVVVVQVTRNHAGIDGGAFPTPRKAGAVRVTGAQGEVLTLTATDGTTFTFDVASRRFGPTTP